MNVRMIGRILGLVLLCPAAKLLLTLVMLLGRLELYPVLAFLSPSTWKR